MTMTDSEIIKALGLCLPLGCDCSLCPLLEETNCYDHLLSEVLALINRQKAEIDLLIRKKETLRDEIAEQQAEIERLREENTALDGANVLLTVTLQNARAEAIKEFAERLKEKYKDYDNNVGVVGKIALFNDIDNLAKELT